MKLQENNNNGRSMVYGTHR